MEETPKKRKLSDITKILIAMVAGSLVGIVVGKPAGYIGFVGDIWLNLMKMFLVPLVVCMLVKGITSMDSPETLGRIGLKIMAFYVFTTIVAGTLGVGLVVLLLLGPVVYCGVIVGVGGAAGAFGVVAGIPLG